MLILHLYVAKINYQIKVGWRKIIIKSLLHSYTATKEQFCVLCSIPHASWTVVIFHPFLHMYTFELWMIPLGVGNTLANLFLT